MRITTNIFLFIVLLNVASGFFAAAGTWDDMGVSYDTDLGEQFQDFNDRVNGVFGDTPGNEGGDLVNLITSGAFFVTGVGEIVLFGAPRLLKAFGAPAFVVMPLAAVLPFIAVKDIVGYLSGRQA